MVTEPGKDDWLILQVIGELSGGDPTLVELPEWTLPRKAMTGALIELFKSEGRFGKLMGVFDQGVVTKCW